MEIVPLEPFNPGFEPATIQLQVQRHSDRATKAPEHIKLPSPTNQQKYCRLIQRLCDMSIL